MVRDEHTPFIEDIPAYAIGALDAEDALALESHLKTCASCRTELAEYRALGESLLMTVPSKQPSAALRKRLQSRLPGAQKSARRKVTISFGRLAVGFAVFALLVLNLFSFMQLRQIQNQQALLLNQMEDAQVALAMLSSPNIQALSLSGGSVSGSLLLDKNQNRAIIIAQNLPALSKDWTYQVWLIEPNGTRISIGLFRPEGGQSYTTKAIWAAKT